MLPALIFAAAALATWPAPLRSAVEAEKPITALAFTGQVKSGAVQMTVEYDSARAAAQRWLVKYPSGRRTNKEENVALEALKQGDPVRDYVCATRAETIPASVTLKNETASEYIYAYQPTAGPKTPKQIAPMLKFMLGEIRVSKVTQRMIGGRVWAPAAFKPAPIAKINSYNQSFECNANGVITHSKSIIDMNALGHRVVDTDLALSEVRRTP